MTASELIKIYRENPFVKIIAEALKTGEHSAYAIKGLSGSLDAILAASLFRLDRQSHVFVLHEKEEAAYFFNDLQNLLGDNKEVLLFPGSYKRPYQFDETENANILMRGEVLNRINNKSSSGEIIVTYPEALTEKVLNKKSLKQNTLPYKIGDEVQTEMLAKRLQGFDYEKVDFVYEAGQFSIRGGIIDVFSYANEFPFRIELWGNEIESIRSFDPENQLSLEDIKSIHLIPNVQTRLQQELRQSFLDFIPAHTKVWFKDLESSYMVMDQMYQKARDHFDDLMNQTGGTQVLLQPNQLFENSESFRSSLSRHIRLEFGKRFFQKDAKNFAFQSQIQPSFHKDFEQLVQDLAEHQSEGFQNLIVADSAKQIERLETIFNELDPFLKIQGINIALREGFVDKQLGIVCYTDHQIFERFHRYKTKSKGISSKALTLKEVKSLQVGDFVVHVDYGIGRFAGLEKVEQDDKVQESVRLIYRDDDLLYVSIHSLHKISKYSGKEGSPPSISKLGSQEWENKKKKVKRKVKDIAKDLIDLYAKRKSAPGYAFSPDAYLQAELESSFLYEDTPDQAQATQHVKDDMEKPHPMDRLVCGDVGFGKTEVAIRAAFKAINDGKQVAVLVPTTILAMQHFRTFQERLKNFPVTTEYINRFRSPKDIKDILQKVKEGKVDVLIGTHRIVNKDVQFKDLGLMIIDEEQKFGVTVKEKLKQMRVNVDSLTLTATPIPRTLHFSLMGARDLSVIATPPPNRQPVTTEIHTFNEEVLRDAIAFELRRGGQVFFVHNRVNDIESIANVVLRLVPEARVGIAHGQMEGKVLEKTMLKFIEGEYDVLCSTNIIESGLDIPNANTIIINRAHMFGLSDLHQMRGRVGRSNKKAFCYLLTPPTIGLSSDARKRLSTLEEFSDLGDGIKVAMRDLDIRGAGNLLGAEQSGFITDLGFDMYHKILDEAVKELKDNEFKSLFQNDLMQNLSELVPDCSIETDLELLIPENYVSQISERLSLYNRLDNIEEESELENFRKELADRFGRIPSSVLDLMETVRLRWLAQQLGFDRISLKNQTMRCYFSAKNKDDYYQRGPFLGVISFVQKNPGQCKMKELKGKAILVLEDIQSVQDALEAFKGMKSLIPGPKADVK